MSIFQFERILIGVFIALILCIAAVGGYLWRVEQQGIPVAKVETPTNLAIMTGTYACLSRLDGATTRECIPSIKMGEEFYALDLAPVIEAGAELGLRAGEKITVGGTFVPIEEISSNQWEVYRVQGVMKVEEVSRE